MAGNQSANNLKLFFQDDMEPGQFASSTQQLDTADFPYSVTAADLDGDGDMDLVSTISLQNHLKVFWQTDTGVFDAESSELPTGAQGNYRCAAVDLDGDKDMDLISANINPQSQNLTLLYQTRPGVFTLAPAPLLTDGAPQSVTAADLDGDGDMDLVTANLFSEVVNLFFGGK